MNSKDLFALFMMFGYSILTVNMDEIKDVASLQFDLESVKAATRNFSSDNKLGEGGFGEFTR